MNAAPDYREQIADLERRVKEAERALIVWLVETLHYPFDMSFSTPPPVDHGKLADYWNESDRWGVTADEARSTVYEEAGISADRIEAESSHGLRCIQAPCDACGAGGGS